MRREYKIGPYTPGFTVPGSAAKNTRRPLNAGPAIARKGGDPARRNGYKTEGNFQLFTEGFHCPGISPAFIGRPYAVLHMDAVKDKTRFLRNVIPAQLCEGNQHGGRISASGNSGKIYGRMLTNGTLASGTLTNGKLERSRRGLSQSGGKAGLKGIHYVRRRLRSVHKLKS